MSKRTYTDQQFIDAVNTSYSIAETLLKLNLCAAAPNYRTFHKVAKSLGLDTAHFKGQAWRKGQTFPPKRPIEDYLSNKHTINSHRLKIRLIEEGIFQRKCYKCNSTTWNSQPIPIQLEHKDGNNQNNNLSNLTLLCPNCHAQTATYCRKKSSLNKIKQPDGRAKPRSATRKVTRPSLQTLQQDVQNLGYCETGRKYGVSDNAIRKWIKCYQKYQRQDSNL